MLSGRPVNAPGTCVSCVMQGSRPILAEVQALLSPSNANQSRRTANGVDFNRLMLLLAVLEKRGGVHVAGCDAYVNVVGGLELDEPAADLAIALAIASSLRDKPIGKILPRLAKSDSQEKFDPFRQSINACRSLHGLDSSAALYRRIAKMT